TCIFLAILWRLLRWPLRAWTRAYKRRGREQLAGGLAGLAEGRYARAERSLAKAAEHPGLRGVALVALAEAAHARGAPDRATAALDQAQADAPAAALTVRARHLLKDGRPADALALLQTQAATGVLTPLGWRLLAEAALAVKDPQTALTALEPLNRAQTVVPAKFNALETRVYVAALAASPDVERLNTLWNGIGRNDRKRPEMIAAFARRSAALGQPLAAMDEIESALRREWNEKLAAVYGDLGQLDLPARTRTAEGWTKSSPNSPALLTTLGRLYRDQSQWSKARDNLERALAAGESALAWETLGDCYRGENNPTGAAECYANALRLTRGEASKPLSGRATAAIADTRALMVEERNELGVPRLSNTQ
ncbi:MAG: heme biosynthesis HemY N-terminal domain-containing protein, partial [Dokdonella sp.]